MRVFDAFAGGLACPRVPKQLRSSRKGRRRGREVDPRHDRVQRDGTREAEKALHQLIDLSLASQKLHKFRDDLIGRFFHKPVP